MDERAFDSLNEHLAEVRPIFDRFCAEKGFEYVDRRSLGRYPRIRIEKRESIIGWLELWMECNHDGRRSETFGRDFPNELART
jgi:hypothetical protein